MGELTVLTDTEPRLRCQTKSEPSSKANNKHEPPAYPIPSERSAKSASVVPTVVVAMMVVQYRKGWKPFALTCATTAARKIAAKMPVPAK